MVESIQWSIIKVFWNGIILTTYNLYMSMKWTHKFRLFHWMLNKSTLLEMVELNLSWMFPYLKKCATQILFLNLQEKSQSSYNLWPWIKDTRILKTNMVAIYGQLAHYVENRENLLLNSHLRCYLQDKDKKVHTMNNQEGTLKRGKTVDIIKKMYLEKLKIDLKVF